MAIDQVIVDQEAGDGLFVELIHGDETVTGGEIHQIGIRRAKIRFTDRCVSLPVGMSYDLHFGDEEDDDESISIPAELVYRADVEQSQTYAFEFLNPDEVEAELSPRMARLFHQRRAFRVHPDTMSDSSVVVEYVGSRGARRGQAQLHDISQTGASVLLPRGVDRELAGIDKLKLTLEIPNFDRPLRFATWIRNRRVVADMISYGLEFESGAHADPESAEALIQFIMGRQRAQLRDRRLV